jgi:hypothetical protein
MQTDIVCKNCALHASSIDFPHQWRAHDHRQQLEMICFGTLEQVVQPVSGVQANKLRPNCGQSRSSRVLLPPVHYQG